MHAPHDGFVTRTPFPEVKYNRPLIKPDIFSVTRVQASALEQSESGISIILSGGSTQDTDDPLLAHFT